jgi:hypothetical protein
MDIAEIVAGLGSGQALQDVAAKVGVPPDQAQAMLQGVLEHVSAGAPLEGMAETVAGRAGVDPGIVQHFLPQVMDLLQGHSENASEGVQGVLGSLMGSLQGGGFAALLSVLDANQNGSITDEAMGLAQGLFKR